MIGMEGQPVVARPLSSFTLQEQRAIQEVRQAARTAIREALAPYGLVAQDASAGEQITEAERREITKAIREVMTQDASAGEQIMKAIEEVMAQDASITKAERREVRAAIEAQRTVQKMRQVLGMVDASTGERITKVWYTPELLAGSEGVYFTPEMRAEIERVACEATTKLEAEIERATCEAAASVREAAVSQLGALGYSRRIIRGTLEDAADHREYRTLKDYGLALVIHATRRRQHSGWRLPDRALSADATVQQIERLS